MLKKVPSAYFGRITGISIKQFFMVTGYFLDRIGVLLYLFRAVVLKPWN